MKIANYKQKIRKKQNYSIFSNFRNSKNRNRMFPKQKQINKQNNKNNK